MNNQNYFLNLFDFVISLFALICLTPLLIIIFSICFIENKNPIFIQKRVGQNLKPFYLYKFRTMKKNTPSLATHLIKKKYITKFGRVLRILKLDELPQLINVLRGDMSLVGPRPCLFNQIELINARQKYNLYQMKPGITGLAQIKGIDMSNPEVLAKFDFTMCSNYNIKSYFKYLFLTTFGKGIKDNFLN